VCLATCQSSLGYLRASQKTFERALAISPKAYTVRMTLAMTYLAGSDKEPSKDGKALEHLMIIVDSGVKYPSAYELAASMKETKGQKGEARSIYARGLAMARPGSKLAKRLKEGVDRLGG
jgi:predicted Zn-dependent protease